MTWFAVAAALMAFAPARRTAEPDLQALYRAHAPSVVFVRATYHHGDSTTTKSSTGVILGGGRILTTCDAVRRGEHRKTDVDEIEVVVGRTDSASGMVKPDRHVPVKLIRCDRDRDLAILRTKLPLPPPLQLATAVPTPGQDAVALGHSWRGLPWTIHRCSIAGVGRPNRDFSALLSAVSPKGAEATRGELESSLMLETDCDRHPMFGSPVMNARGQVMGVLQVAHFDPSDDSPQKYYFYLAATEIQAFLDES